MKAVAQLQDLALPRAQFQEQVLEPAEVHVTADLLLGGADLRVGEDLLKRLLVLVVAQGLVDGDRALGALQDAVDARRVQAHLPGDLVQRRLGAGHAGHLAHHPQDAVLLLAHVARDADGGALAGDGAVEGVLDPPGRVGGQARALGGVEALHGPQQADVALADEVGQVHALLLVLAGEEDDQALVGQHQVLAGLLEVLDLLEVVVGDGGERLGIGTVAVDEALHVGRLLRARAGQIVEACLEVHAEIVEELVAQGVLDVLLHELGAAHDQAADGAADVADLVRILLRDRLQGLGRELLAGGLELAQQHREVLDDLDHAALAGALVAGVLEVLPDAAVLPQHELQDAAEDVLDAADREGRHDRLLLAVEHDVGELELTLAGQDAVLVVVREALGGEHLLELVGQLALVLFAGGPGLRIIVVGVIGVGGVLILDHEVAVILEQLDQVLHLVGVERGDAGEPGLGRNGPVGRGGLRHLLENLLDRALSLLGHLPYPKSGRRFKHTFMRV